MKVKLMKDHSVIEVNGSYGLRLISQGKAVIAPPGAELVKKKADKPKGDA